MFMLRTFTASPILRFFGTLLFSIGFFILAFSLAFFAFVPRFERSFSNFLMSPLAFPYLLMFRIASSALDFAFDRIRAASLLASSRMRFF